MPEYHDNGLEGILLVYFWILVIVYIVEIVGCQDILLKVIAVCANTSTIAAVGFFFFFNSFLFVCLFVFKVDPMPSVILNSPPEDQESQALWTGPARSPGTVVFLRMA